MKITLFFLMILMFVSVGCAKKENLLFIVDTSGSMQENRQLDKVKTSIKNLLLEYKSGDEFFLMTFDSSVRSVYQHNIDSNNDLKEIYKKVDEIEAAGAWTNLIVAIDKSLETVFAIKEKYPERKTKLVLYTDGKHDLPKNHPDSTNLNFNDLFSKYYNGYNADKPMWFIYYVELDKLDPDLKKFLDKTKSGKVITSETVSKNSNFIKEVNKWIPIVQKIGIAFGVLFIIYLLFFIIRPWFKNATIIQTSSKFHATGSIKTFSLANFKKTFLRSYLTIGSSGDIKIEGTDDDAKLVGIGMDFKGKLFLKPFTKEDVLVDGRKVTSKTRVEVGQKIKIGGNEFMIGSTAKKKD